MASFTFYLDCRRLRADGTACLKVALSHGGRRVFLPLDLSIPPDMWDARTAHVDRRWRYARQTNLLLDQYFEAVDDAVRALSKVPSASMEMCVRAVERALGRGGEAGTFMPALEEYAYGLSRGTQGLYAQTAARIRAYDPQGCEALSFEDVDFNWLTRFEAFLAQTESKNARNIHLRNIRAVFNRALDEEATAAYPFRRFKIRPVATPKRSLSVERLRELISYPVVDWQVRHRDMWLLSFMLCGINMVDVCRLREVTAEGRVEYNRAKTHRLYSIKVEPEAAAIIDKYHGREYLLDISERYGDYRDYLKRCNRGLQSIGEVERHGLGGKKSVTAAFPGLTTYWARHTWATVAASLDIPRDTIAHALGHGGNTVTDIYIDFDQSKVDDANRRVLDWVLYGRR